jgi:hypothetical protein
LKSIKDPGIAVDPALISELASHLPGILEIFQIESKKLEWTTPHVATTMGPSGPSMLQACNLIPPVLKRLGNLFEDLGASKLREYMESIDPLLIESWRKLYPPKRDCLRRLATVLDTDGKCRMIAMLDYWSQSILRVCHIDIMSILARIQKIDMTFGQGIAPFGSPDHDYHSFDLTAATDRFPVVITEVLLAHMYGPSYASAWKKIMTSEPFLWKSESVLYGRGQPMGAYSSWASFSLTHHMVVQWSAIRAGIPAPFLDYRLLGDDIVIRNNRVAEEYSTLMALLGVEISPAKTIISNDSFEFAKRFFLHEEEVTGYPIAGMVQTVNRWSELAQVMAEATKRGYPSPMDVGPRDFSGLLRSIYEADPVGSKIYRSSSFRNRLYRKIQAVCWLWSRGSSPEQTLRLCRLWSFDHSCNLRVETIRFIILEALAQIKANQLLDSLRTQVKRINSYVSDLKSKVSDSEISLTSVPLLHGLMSNVSDMQGQMEDFRELSKQASRTCPEVFERILFENHLVPDINPETLDSSRRSLRALASDSQMTVRGFVLLSNVSREISAQLGSEEVNPEEDE